MDHRKCAQAPLSVRVFIYFLCMIGVFWELILDFQLADFGSCWENFKYLWKSENFQLRKIGKTFKARYILQRIKKIIQKSELTKFSKEKAQKKY